jgi:hypothetical protein
MTKTHDRDYFCKYVTADTARRILQNRTVKWSSPLLFNDPFDTQFDLRFGFELDELPPAFAAEFEKLIYGKDEPTCDPRHPMGLMIHVLRQTRDKVPKEELLGPRLLAALGEGVANARRVLDQQNLRWRDYLRQMRVFCVAEEHNDLLMWAHYTDSHRGAVIKFKCLPQRDTALCAARRVDYRREIPGLGSLHDWIKHLTAQVRLDFSNLFLDLAFTKSAHWSYEKEWRCWWTVAPGNRKELHDFAPIFAQEVESIYLGCKITEEDRLDLIGLLAGDFSHVEVYQAEPSKKRFELEFHRLDRPR